MVRIHLSRLLGEKRMSQKKLAELTGIRANTISEWYNEITISLKVEHIDRICEVLGNHIPFLVLKSGNISRKFVTKKMRSCDKNFGQLQISKKMRKRVEVFTGKKMDTQSSYGMMEDSGELAHGTISFYHQMMDGSVCVAVYSTAYDDLYDMYKLGRYEGSQAADKR
ncbi:MAG: helix-turn-helix transcriptional regulator [Eubacterium sp.]|nr:helix-turn-helix transcriptional regulator [Eubacterium sp.]